MSATRRPAKRAQDSRKKSAQRGRATCSDAEARTRAQDRLAIGLQDVAGLRESASIDLDLFAGAGGLTLGLSAAGFIPNYLLEMNKYCCATLEHNARAHVRGTVLKEDISSVDWRDFRKPVRLLAAGPPCQPFSFAGKHLAQRDGRNQFPAALRAFRELRPAAVLLENVPGLSRPTFLPYLEYIQRQLACPSLSPRSGETWEEHDKRIKQHQKSRSYVPEYHVCCWVVNAADFGVPQARLRVIVAATRAEYCAIQEPRPTHSRAALIREQEAGNYWTVRHLPAKTRREWPRRVHGQSPRLGDHLLPWNSVRDALSGLGTPAATDVRGDHHWLIPGARLYARHSGSELDWPAKTLKAGVHGVAGGENILVLDDGTHRYFTLREMARLQGFPDDYMFEGPRSRVIGQIGNAVPRELGRILGLAVKEALNSSHATSPAQHSPVRANTRHGRHGKTK